MPDLSKRPERYATAVVALLAAGTFAYSAVGIRFGPDARVAELEAHNRQLEAQLAAVPAASATAEQTVVPKITTVASKKNCSAFGTQEAAQAFWNLHKKEYPAWDGNHNGVACEQLKKAKPTPGATHIVTSPATVIRTVDIVAKQNSTALNTEPAAPSQLPVRPVVSKPTVPSKATILASRQHFGLYAATNEEYNNLESTLARDTSIRGYFEGFDTGFRPDAVNSAWAGGEIPMLTWESRPLNDAPTTVDYSLDNIAAGGFDSYLKAYAAGIVANGLPLVIRFDQEMNGNWYRWDEMNPNYTNTKGSYIAAWRHVHDVFQAAGANNLVIWDWSPNRIDNIKRLPSIDNYYPGDAYTDWVGMTGYYRPGDKAPTFDSTFTATLNSLRATAPGKPIVLSEVGATEAGNQKVNWVNSFFAGLPQNPDVIGFVWFNYAVTSAGVTNDWRIQSSDTVTTAFRTGLYADAFGRDKGKKPILVTTTPTAAPSATPSASPTASPTGSASSTTSRSSTVSPSATASPSASATRSASN